MRKRDTREFDESLDQRLDHIRRAAELWLNDFAGSKMAENEGPMKCVCGESAWIDGNDMHDDRKAIFWIHCMRDIANKPTKQSDRHRYRCWIGPTAKTEDEAIYRWNAVMRFMKTS